MAFQCGRVRAFPGVKSAIARGFGTRRSRQLQGQGNRRRLRVVAPPCRPGLMALPTWAGGAEEIVWSYDSIEAAESEIVRLCALWESRDPAKENIPTVIELIDDVTIMDGPRLFVWGKQISCPDCA